MSYSTSGSLSPSSPAKIRHRSLVDHLQTGFNAAEQLRRRLLRSPDSDEDLSLSDVDLAELIFNSFSNSLAIATSSDSSVMANPKLISADGCKTEEEGSGRGESSRIKDRRGCYKRRKRGQSRTTEGEAPKEDGHAWRKYGQKMILNSKFPRNYYRCTHKTDQGCQAQKQVQKVSDEPPLYRTTYSGDHTCKSPHKTPAEVMIPDQSDSSFLVSFERTSNHHISPFFPTPVKEELLTTQAMMNMMMMSNQPCLSDYAYLSSPDLTAAGPHLASTPTPAGSDYGGDVISVGTASPPSLEIEHYILGQDHLDDLIQFD